MYASSSNNEIHTLTQTIATIKAQIDLTDTSKNAKALTTLDDLYNRTLFTGAEQKVFTVTGTTERQVLRELRQAIQTSLNEVNRLKDKAQTQFNHSLKRELFKSVAQNDIEYLSNIEQEMQRLKATLENEQAKIKHSLEQAHTTFQAFQVSVKENLREQLSKINEALNQEEAAIVNVFKTLSARIIAVSEKTLYKATTGQTRELGHYYSTEAEVVKHYEDIDNYLENIEETQKEIKVKVNKATDIKTRMNALMGQIDTATTPAKALELFQQAKAQEKAMQEIDKYLNKQSQATTKRYKKMSDIDTLLDIVLENWETSQALNNPTHLCNPTMERLVDRIRRLEYQEPFRSCAPTKLSRVVDFVLGRAKTSFPKGFEQFQALADFLVSEEIKKPDNLPKTYLVPQEIWLNALSVYATEIAEGQADKTATEEEQIAEENTYFTLATQLFAEADSYTEQSLDSLTLHTKKNIQQIVTLLSAWYNASKYLRDTGIDTQLHIHFCTTLFESIETQFRTAEEKIEADAKKAEEEKVRLDNIPLTRNKIEELNQQKAQLEQQEFPETTRITQDIEELKNRIPECKVQLPASTETAPSNYLRELQDNIASTEAELESEAIKESLPHFQNRLEEAQANISAYLSQKAEIDNALAQAKAALEQYRSQLLAMKPVSEKFEADSQSIQSEITKLQEVLSASKLSLQEKEDALRKTEDTLTGNKAAKDQANQAKAAIEKELEAHQNANAMRLQKYQQSLEALDAELKTLSEHKQELSEVLEGLANEEGASTREALGQTEATLREKQQTLNDLRSNFEKSETADQEQEAAINARLAEATIIVEAAEKATTETESMLPSQKANLERAHEDHATIEKALQAATAKLTENQSHRQALDENPETAQEVAAQTADITAELSRLERELTNITSESQNLAIKIENAQGEKQEFENMIAKQKARLESLAQDCANWSSEFDALQQRQASLPVAKELASLQAQLEEKNRLLPELDAVQAEHQDNIKRIDTEIQKERTALDELEQARAKFIRNINQALNTNFSEDAEDLTPAYDAYIHSLNASKAQLNAWKAMLFSSQTARQAPTAGAAISQAEVTPAANEANAEAAAVDSGAGLGLEIISSATGSETPVNAHSDLKIEVPTDTASANASTPTTTEIPADLQEALLTAVAQTSTGFFNQNKKAAKKQEEFKKLLPALR